jgi:hypothetical protein
VIRESEGGLAVADIGGHAVLHLLVMIDQHPAGNLPKLSQERRAL